MKKRFTRIISFVLMIAVATSILSISVSAYSTLRLGSRGDEVKQLQSILNQVNNAKLNTDGVFGDATHRAVIAFQRSHALDPDGIVGSKTWAALEAQYKISQKVSNLKISSDSNVTVIPGTSVQVVVYFSGQGIDSVKYSSSGSGLNVKIIDSKWRPYPESCSTTLMVSAASSFRSGTISFSLYNNDLGVIMSRNISVSSGTSSKFAATESKVHTYSLKSDGNINLSSNFKVREFRCLDGSDKILIDQKLVALLQDIRDHFGKPVVISSAYRTESHNRKPEVGGAKNSQHLYGKAADIRISGISPLQIAKYAEGLGVKGIGLYDTFVHVDTRTTKAFWITHDKHTTSTSSFT